jgi:hypothetical protein
MSRALNVNATEAEIVTICTANGISTTAMEMLIPSGTRVVCQSSEGAVVLRKKMKTRLIDGPIVRSPRFVAPSAMR